MTEQEEGHTPRSESTSCSQGASISIADAVKVAFSVDTYEKWFVDQGCGERHKRGQFSSCLISDVITQSEIV